MASKVKMPLDGALGAWEMSALEVIGRPGKKCRDQLFPVNGHEVDIVLRIKGTVNVSPDGESTRKDKPSQEKLVGCFLEKLRIMADDESDPEHKEFLTNIGSDIMAMIRADAQSNQGVLPDPTPQFEVAAEKFVAAVTTTKTSSRRGAVSGNFSIGVVDLQQATAQAVATVKSLEQSLGTQFVTRRFISGGED